jgi:hypothetical protein
MPIDLTLPITAVSALALAAALTFTGWLPLPRVRLRAQNEKHGPLRVIELALVMSPTLAGRQQGAGAGPARRATEFVVYITLKTCNP